MEAIEEDISLRDVILMLKHRKILIIAATLGAGLLGLLYAIFATPLYVASVTVQPVTQDTGSLSNLVGEFGGIAALAGINLSGNDTTRSEYLAVLRSRELGQHFIERYEMLPLLFPDSWDSKTNQWKSGSHEGTGIRRSLSQLLANLSDDEGWSKIEKSHPSMWDAYRIFNDKIRDIAEDNSTGLVTVSFEFKNPRKVAEWANAYVAMANNGIRQRAIDETTKALAFLNDEAEKTTTSGVRDTVYALVQRQLETIMVAKSRDEYAFRVIDKAVPPEDRSHPRRTLIVLLSLVVGAAIGIFSALVLEIYKSTNSQNTNTNR